MANVNIKFNNKEFLLSCDDGQEEHLEELSNQINEKFNDLKNHLGNIGESKLLLITSIKVMDEYFETKKNIEIKKRELEQLKQKFKELKRLVYEFRDDKEKKIKILELKYEKLDSEFLENKKNYDKFIDNTTFKIEEFLNKAKI